MRKKAKKRFQAGYGVRELQLNELWTRFGILLNNNPDIQGAKHPLLVMLLAIVYVADASPLPENNLPNKLYEILLRYSLYL